MTSPPLRVKFTPETRDDLRDALDWYEQADPSHADAFDRRLGEVVELIRDRPAIYARCDGEVRRASLRPFPYSLFYRIEPNLIRVLLIDDDRRDPARRTPRLF